MQNKSVFKISIPILILAAICGAWFFLSKNSEKKVIFPEKIKIEETLELTGEKEQESQITDSPGTKDEATEKSEKRIEYPKITYHLLDWGFEKLENRKIDTVIIHTSYDALHPDDPYSIDGIIEEFKPYGVASHYIIGRSGEIVCTVKEEDVAYHAGVSQVPDGRTGVNYFSIGIEMVNDKEGKLTDAEYGALRKLLAALESKYDIKYVLGHNEIAPDRKTDPWNFDWKRIGRVRNR